jgi:RNA polymerase sigma-70 factor (ECF subfamily)
MPRSWREIARLDDIDRALTLLLLDGFGYQEMAATLGLTDSNVGRATARIGSSVSLPTPWVER